MNPNTTEARQNPAFSGSDRAPADVWHTCLVNKDYRSRSSYISAKNQQTSANKEGGLRRIKEHGDCSFCGE